MKSIIRDIWQDKINPSVDVNSITPEIKKLYAKIEAVEESLQPTIQRSKGDNLRNTQTYIVNAQAYYKKHPLRTGCVLE